MKLTLQITGYVVELYDYLPQFVYEAIEDIASGGTKIDIAEFDRITVDDIAEQLSPEAAQKIQNEPDDVKREQLLREAKKQVMAAKLPKREMGVAEAHALQHAQLGVVKSLDGSETAILERCRKLPHQDFEQLVAAIDGVAELSQAKAGKADGQLAASSQASPQIAQISSGRPEGQS